MFVLVLKSGKGSGNAATFPAVALMLMRGRMFRGLSRWSWLPILPKIFINKLPRLASVPLTEVVLQTLSIQSRDFEEIFLISSRRRAIAFSATFVGLSVSVSVTGRPLVYLTPNCTPFFNKVVQPACRSCSRSTA